MALKTLSSALLSSTVSIGATQAGLTVDPVTKVNYGSTAEVVISLRKQQSVPAAPFAIYLDADPTGFTTTAASTETEFDPAFTDIEYIWSIEKVGDPTWQTGTYSKPANVPTENKAKGTKFGQRISHVFGDEDITGASSTFRFTVTAIEVSTGVSATSSAYDVVVQSIDSYWTADETFIVRVSGATNYPTTTNAISSSFTSAVGAAATSVGAGNITKYRICVERGQTHTGSYFNSFGGPTATLIDTWGTGANPECTGDRFFLIRSNTSSSVVDFQLVGIDRRNVGTNAGFTLNPRAAEPESMVTMWDCNVEDTNEFYTVSTNAFNGYLTIANCSALGTRFVVTGGLESGFASSYIGCSFLHKATQNSDQRSGGGYGLRPEITNQFYFSQTEIFVRQGWFNNAPGIQTTQPVIRLWWNSADQPDGARAMIDRNYIEGQVTVNDDGGNSDVANFVYERNVHVGIHDTGWFISGLPKGGIVRNNQFTRPPSPPANNQTNNNFVTNAVIAFNNEGTGWGDRAAKIYSNTIISLQNTAVLPDVWEVKSGDTISNNPTASNNVIHAPNASTPTVFGTFTQAANAAPYYDGYDDRRTVTVATPQYEPNIGANTVTGTFQVGETVEGQTSGVQKTYVGTFDRFQAGTSLLFEDTEVFDALDVAAGFQRFTAGEQLVGLTSGATVNLTSSAVYGQPFDTGNQLIGDIPDTVTPTHQVTVSGVGGFVPGETVTTASGTAYVCQVIGSTIYLVDPTGSIASGEAITSASGSGTTTSAIASSGVGDLWTPTSNNAADALYSPYDLLGNERNAGNAIKGALV